MNIWWHFYDHKLLIHVYFFLFFFACLFLFLLFVCLFVFLISVSWKLSQNYLRIYPINGSSRPEVFCEKRCSWKFHKIYRKTPVLESIFNKVTDLRLAALFKKRLWHRCFPANFVKFSRTPFSIEHLRWLLLYNWFRFWCYVLNVVIIEQ